MTTRPTYFEAARRRRQNRNGDRAYLSLVAILTRKGNVGKQTQCTLGCLGALPAIEGDAGEEVK